MTRRRLSNTLLCVALVLGACRARDRGGIDFFAVTDGGNASSGVPLKAGASADASGAAPTGMTAALALRDASAANSFDGDAGSHDAALSGAPVAQDPQCDLNGVWIARQTTFSRDSVFSAVQTASSWSYFVFEQRGRDFSVSEALDCGIQASGSADVTLNQATTAALIKRNDQHGRHGTFYQQGGACVFTLDRFYSTRGVARATYLPADTSSHPDLGSLQPALPTQQAPAGAEDGDGDGEPGIAFNVKGIGSRHVVQRDWNELYSNASYPVALGATRFVVRASFDHQEEILATTGGIGGLLLATATPANELEHRATFQRLGRQASDPAVSAVRVASDIDTCYNVQDALPHDPAMH